MRSPWRSSPRTAPCSPAPKASGRGLPRASSTSCATRSAASPRPPPRRRRPPASTAPSPTPARRRRCGRGADRRGAQGAGAVNEAAPRVVAPEHAALDAAEASLRPLALAEFIGQKALRDNLRVFIAAARSRGEALDHVLLAGPPGLGKTTLAGIVARELGVGFRATSGPVIQRAGD